MKKLINRGIIIGSTIFTIVLLVASVIVAGINVSKNIDANNQFAASQAQVSSLKNEIIALNAQNAQLLVAMQMPIVAGKVYVDTNSNGILDPEDQPIQNIEVDIYTMGSPEASGHAITDVNGTYLFRMNAGTLNGMGIQNTEKWNVTWLDEWPIVMKDRGVYLGPIIFLTRVGEKG